MKERERETAREEGTETHRRCAVLKAGIISCITETQKRDCQREQGRVKSKAWSSSHTNTSDDYW